MKELSRTGLTSQFAVVKGP